MASKEGLSVFLKLKIMVIFNFCNLPLISSNALNSIVILFLFTSFNPLSLEPQLHSIFTWKFYQRHQDDAEDKLLLLAW